MFGDHKKKDTRIGLSYQASEIPLVTDIQYYEYLQDLDKRNEGLCQVRWLPDRLPEAAVSKVLMV